MAWLAVDKNGDESIYDAEPDKKELFGIWKCIEDSYYIYLPKGSIKKLIGRELTWEDDPVELKE